MSDTKCGGGSGQVFGGTAWAMGWMFTIGYLHLHFWPGVLAMIIWPWYIGHALAVKYPL
jgi:hypothetical protein